MEALEVDFLDVEAVDVDTSLLDIVGPHDHLDDGALARAAVADDGCHLVGPIFARPF